MTASIRAATPPDLEALLELMRGYYRDDGLTFNRERAAVVMSRLLTEPQWGFVLVLEEDAALLGYVAVCVGFSLELGGNDAFIDEIFVLPRARGAGRGRRLLAEAVRIARERGVVALHLEVDRENDVAQALYAHLGFERRDRYFLMTTPSG